MMECTLVPHDWKEFVFHKGISWSSQSIHFVEWNNSGRTRE